jgi:hypothetical protein
LATALSTGTDLAEWLVPEAVNVLIVDGEMTCEDTRDRLKGMFEGNEKLSILNHEQIFAAEAGPLNLTDPLQQKVITQLCINKSTQVVIFDNLSCLFSGMDENDANAWEKVLFWILDFRRRGIAVIFVAHAGREGKHMRGTTRREDAADWITHVERVDGKTPNEEGVRFEVSFTKQRHGRTQEWVRRCWLKTEIDGQVSTKWERISIDEKVAECVRNGLNTPTLISEDMEASMSSISKAALRLQTAGIIQIVNRKYVYVPGSEEGGEETGISRSADFSQTSKSHKKSGKNGNEKGVFGNEEIPKT